MVLVVNREELFAGICKELGKENCEERKQQDDGELVLQVLLKDICNFVWYYDHEGATRILVESFDYKKGEPKRPSPELMSHICKLLDCPICAFNYSVDMRSIKLPGEKGYGLFDIKMTVFVWGNDRENIIKDYENCFQSAPEIQRTFAIFT